MCLGVQMYQKKRKSRLCYGDIRNGDESLSFSLSESLIQNEECMLFALLFLAALLHTLRLARHSSIDFLLKPSG